MINLKELVSIKGPARTIIFLLLLANGYLYKELSNSQEKEENLQRKYDELQNKVIQLVLDEKNDLKDRAKFWQDFSIITGRINNNEENNSRSGDVGRISNK